MSSSTALGRDGIEFIFAMFVDLHGKPCAKLVPASAIDQLLTDGAGFAGFAAGAMGQTAVVPGHHGHAGPDLVHARTVAARAGHPPVRPHVRGRAMALSRRGSSFAGSSSAWATPGLSMKVGAEVEYFLVRRAADGSHRGGRPPGPWPPCPATTPAPSPGCTTT